MTDTERSRIADEFEVVRAPGLSIADAARTFANETENLEWALWATEPGVDRGNFNQDYADRQLVESAPTWRKARDELRAALDDHFRVFQSPETP